MPLTALFVQAKNCSEAVTKDETTHQYRCSNGQIASKLLVLSKKPCSGQEHCDSVCCKKKAEVVDLDYVSCNAYHLKPGCPSDRPLFVETLDANATCRPSNCETVCCRAVRKDANLFVSSSSSSFATASSTIFQFQCSV